MVELNPWKWSKEGTAQFVYDTLDPVFGEGGVLEPVTVIVDRDRTVYGEYIEPKVENIQEGYSDWSDNNLGKVTDTAVLFGLAALYLLGRK